MMMFPFINWGNGALKQTLAAGIACSCQIWVGAGFVSMLAMPEVSTGVYPWLVSSSQIVEFVTIIPAIWMSSLLGKKTVMQMAAVPAIAAYILLSQADHILDLFIARALQGVSSGLVSGVLPLYLTDISTENVRASFNLIQISLWYLGVTITLATAPFIPVMPFTLVLLSLTLVWSVMMCWIPESPWYYVERGKEAKALDSLAWLRGSQDTARREYDTSFSDRIQATWRELLSKQVSVITLLGVLHWAFVPALLVYSYDTLYSLTGNDNTSRGLQVGQGILCILVSLGSSCLLESTPRRTLLIRSLLVSILVGLPPSAYLFYFTRYPSSSYVYVTPIVIFLILLYPVLSSITFHPLSLNLPLEILYKDKHKKSSVFISHLSALLTFISCALYPILRNIEYDFVNFSLLTATSFFALIYIYFFLPETKDKHIFEINRLFRS